MSLIHSTKRLLLALAALLVIPAAFANEGEEHKKEEFNVNEMIMHHISDAHEWHLWGGHHDAASIYLPIILIDNGVQTFSSRSFYKAHPVEVKDANGAVIGHYSVDASGKYALYHEKIYKLDENGGMTFNAEGHPENAKPLDLSITKNVLSLFFGSIIILILLSATARYYKKNGAVAPKGLAKFLEPMILMVRNIAQENIGEHKYKRYVPLLSTIFFFVWINNMLGMVPIIPGGANLTGNISFTFVLALIALLFTVFSGNRNYWGHIFATPGVPLALLPIMIPIELVGILTKPFALMIRLFANMAAGHIIVLALLSIIFINQSAAWGFLSVPMALFISVLELLVAFLQAYLFAMLTGLFIGAAVEEGHH